MRRPEVAVGEHARVVRGRQRLGALIEAGWTLEQIRTDHDRAPTASERVVLIAKVRTDDEGDESL